MTNYEVFNDDPDLMWFLHCKSCLKDSAGNPLRAFPMCDFSCKDAGCVSDCLYFDALDFYLRFTNSYPFNVLR